MLKTKYKTTLLVSHADRVKLEELPVTKVSPFRIFWIMSNVFRLLFGSGKLIGRKPSPAEKALQIRLFLERMGGMWMKVGQVLSMRTDLFSLEFCQELSNLQDRAYAFSAKRSRELVEESLGRPIEQVFDEFEHHPFAAASLSQVHRARLKREQAWVAVKVQRPYAAEYFDYDMKWLSRFFKVLIGMGFQEHFLWDEMLLEIRHMMEEELDYRQEAANMRKFRKALKKHRVYVPKVFRRYCSEKLLVMEFLDGVFMSEYLKVLRENPAKVMQWNDHNNIDPEKVAKRLLNSMLRQLYEDRLFHGDLHPGNIMVLKKNRLALIDFGNVGLFDADFAMQHDQFSRAMAKGQIAKAADIYIVILGQLPALDVFALKKDLKRVFQKQLVRSSIKGMAFEEKSLSGNMAETGEAIASYKIRANWDMLKMARSFSTIDQNIGILNPGIDYYKEIYRYHKNAAKRRAMHGPDVRGMFRTLSDVTQIMTPVLVSRAFQFTNQLGVGRRIAAYMLSMTKRIFFLGLIAVVWIYLYQHHYNVVGELHHADHFVTKWLESVPDVPKLLWLVALIVLGGMIMKLRGFVKNLLKPPVRLPGSTQ